MSVRLRRLYAEYERLKVLFAGHERIQIAEAIGDPPDRYIIEYRVKGLTETKEGIQESSQHRVQITLGPNYPNEMASCIVVGKPVFHPNIDHLAVCTADVSSASRTLDQTIVFIGELITFQAYNLQSPRNGEAKKWTEANLSRLPLERVNLVPRQLLEGASLPVPRAEEAIAKPATQPKCANCGRSDPGAALKECLGHHLTCSDCALPCSNCPGTLCLVCALQLCSECRQPVCADCTVTCSSCSRKACPAHAWQCPACSAIRCRNCSGTCSRCGGLFCRNHLDMAGRCPGCGASAMARAAHAPLAGASPAPVARPPQPSYGQVIEAQTPAVRPPSPAPEIQPPVSPQASAARAIDPKVSAPPPAPDLQVPRPAAPSPQVSGARIIEAPPPAVQPYVSAAPIQSTPAPAAAAAVARVIEDLRPSPPLAPTPSMQSPPIMPAAPNSSHLEAGGLISGRYRVMGMLGQGGMSKVYLAEDTHLSRNVALKVIQPGQTANAQEFQFLRNALLQEARLAGRLNHPNIVTIYDSFELGDLVCVSMEYVQGLTLERTMEQGLLTERKSLLRVLIEVARALDYAHGEGVVHRDIKPSNIMIQTRSADLQEAARVKVADFGIARESGRITMSSRTRKQTMVIGTPGYMSPEQLLGLPADGRSDQFCLAIMAHELLTGKTLFQAIDTDAWAAKVKTAEPELDSGLATSTQLVLARALNKDRLLRYSRCGEFIGELERAIAAPIPVPQVAIPAEQPALRSSAPPPPSTPIAVPSPSPPVPRVVAPAEHQAPRPPALSPPPAPASRVVITADEARGVPQSALLRPGFRQQIAPAKEPARSGKAIAALIFGIAGLPMIGILVGWFAIWFGAMALRQINGPEKLRGRKAAISGLALGIVDIVVWAVPIAIYIHRHGY